MYERPTLSKSLTTLTVCAAALVALAEASKPPREFSSADGRLLLRIDRGKPPASECRGELARLEPDREKLWSRPLVNDVAPEMAFIRTDGQFVITLNEARRGGARHALVIYGQRGELLRHWMLSDLLGEADWSHVTVEQKSLNWLDEAEFAFVQPDRFEIQLGWERKVVIDLARLALVDPPPTGGAVPPAIAALLWPKTKDGEANPAHANATDGVDPAADGGSDESAAISEDANSEMHGNEGADDEDEVPSLVDILAEVAAGPEDSNEAAPRPTEPRDEPESVAAEPQRGTTADPIRIETTAFGVISVPQPDPANPVDYVAWANQFLQSDPTAIAVKDAAINGIVEFAGDAALLERAQAGDPAAINDPAIAAWLDANRESLQNFRNWTLYDYHGREMHSGDGMMIGVLLPDLSKLRTLTRTSMVDARRRAATGDTDGAIDTLMDNLRAGRHAGQGVTLIETLVGHAMQSLTSDTLLDLAADPASGSKIDYSDLAARLEYSYELPPAPADIVQFERAMGLDTMQRVFQPGQDGGPPTPRWDKLNTVFALMGTEQADFTTMLKAAGANYDGTVAQLNDFYDAAGAALRNPYPTAAGELRSLEESVNAMGKQNPLLSAFAPNLGKVAEVTARSEARRRATLLVTNLMAYKQQNGVFPESLDAFAERPFTRDPFTESGFRYERTADGSFRLYSTGADQVDNGGIADDKNTDVVFWPRPPKKK